MFHINEYKNIIFDGVNSICIFSVRVEYIDRRKWRVISGTWRAVTTAAADLDSVYQHFLSGAKRKPSNL